MEHNSGLSTCCYIDIDPVNLASVSILDEGWVIDRTGVWDRSFLPAHGGYSSDPLKPKDPEPPVEIPPPADILTLITVTGEDGQTVELEYAVDEWNQSTDRFIVDFKYKEYAKDAYNTMNNAGFAVEK